MDEYFLAERLKQTREEKGLTQQQVADALGVPRTAITQIENANRNVSTLELSKLAALYRCQVTDFLTQRPNAFSALLRAAPTVRQDAALREKIEEYLQLCREGIALEKILGIAGQQTPPQYEKSLPQNAMHAIRQGEQVAREERQRLGLGALPIPDIAELISDQGIWVVCAEFPDDDLSGMCLRDDSIGIAILVNHDHHRHRRRFSFAHEYAHALLDGDNPVNLTGRQNAQHLIEKRANGFAAEFLIPAEGVAAQLEALQKLPLKDDVDILTGEAVRPSRKQAQMQEITYQDVALLARHFGVSYDVAAYRLSGLRYLNKSALDGLLARRDIARDYMKVLALLEDDSKSEAPQPTREIVRHLSYLAIEAYRREDISRGKLLEIARLVGHEDTLLEFAEAARFEAC